MIKGRGVEKNYISPELEGRSHVLLTRFGVGVFDERWLDLRFKIFESLTLPSILAQKGGKVIWFLFIDSDAPQRFVSRLERLVGEYSFIKLVMIDFYFQYFEVSKEICREVLSKNRAVLLSKIDDDDLLHRNFFEILYDECNASSDCVYTFPVGYEILLKERVVLKCKRPFLTHNTHYLITTESSLDLIKVGHHKIENYCSGNGIDVRVMSEKEPLYLYARHKQSDSNFVSVRKRILSDDRSSQVTAAVYDNFSINKKKYHEVREECKRSLASPREKTWRINHDLNKKAGEKYKELVSLKGEIIHNGSDVFG